MREAHLRVALTPLVCRVGPLGDELRQRSERQLALLHPLTVVGQCVGLQRRLVGVPNAGRHGGDEVGVDRADLPLQQRVDQAALAVLERAEDDHLDRLGAQPLASLAQMLVEVGPTSLGGQLPTGVDRPDDVLHHLGGRRSGGRRGRRCARERRTAARDRWVLSERRAA